MPEQTVTWALVANSGFAQIYEIKGHGKEIKEILQIDNPDGRMKSGEILSDRPGRSFDSMGGSRHALGTEVDPHVHEQKIFAHKLVEILKKGIEGNSFQQLALIAPPQFLGELKLVLSENLKKIITKEINKDLPIYQNGKKRIEAICEYLDLWNHQK